MRGKKIHVVYLCIIFSYAFFFGVLVDAWVPWTYTHAGSDTLKHLYKTKFLLDNWPNTQWNPQWAAGCPFLVTYPPSLYYLTSSSVQLFGISIEFAYILIIGISYCLFGLGLYGFIFEIVKNKEVSVATAFLGVSSPLIWRLHTRMGLGMDVCSLGFSSFGSMDDSKTHKQSEYGKTVRKNVSTQRIFHCAIYSISFLRGCNKLRFMFSDIAFLREGI